jgi:hypothetical protein
MKLLYARALVPTLSAPTFAHHGNASFDTSKEVLPGGVELGPVPGEPQP